MNAESKNKNGTIDVIIPTCKPDGSFTELLARLNRQTIIPNKIIVINTEKDYLQEESYAGFSNVEVHHITFREFDHAATRHKGITLSDAEFVIFMTQDALPRNNQLIEELITPFEDEKIALAYARQLPKRDCNIIERHTRSFNYPDRDGAKGKEDIEALGIKAYFCSDVCAAYRRDIYHQVGGFVEKAIFNEDTLYAAKILNAGYKIYYASRALVVHSHNYTALQYFHRNFDLGVSQREYRDVFEKLSSEEEGIKLVMDTAKYLVSIKKPYLIPELVIKSGFKYLGFRMGKQYDKLPEWLVKKCTMNKRYWEE